MTAAETLRSANETVSHSEAAKELLAVAPSATNAMMRLGGAKIRAMAAKQGRLRG